MDRPSYEQWLKLSGLPAPPAELVDEVRRQCAVYVLKHGGDPGLVWDVTISGLRVTVYHDWIFMPMGPSPAERESARERDASVTQILRTHLGRFENDPEAWMYLGTRAWLPLSLVPRGVIDHYGPTGVSGEARVTGIGRSSVEFTLRQSGAPVSMLGDDALRALRTDQIMLAPALPR